MGFVQSLVSLHLPSTGERPGRKPHRDWTKVLRRDGSSTGHTVPAGGRVVPVTSEHAAPQDRLRAAAAHQTEPWDGDSNLQKAAGRRGSVSKGHLNWYMARPLHHHNLNIWYVRRHLYLIPLPLPLNRFCFIVLLVICYVVFIVFPPGLKKHPHRQRVSSGLI